MKEDITKYARLGLVHHMLYPECMVDAEVHVQTLEIFVRRDDIETFDCCLPYGQEQRDRLVKAIRQSGKEDIAFALHHFPFDKFKLAATSYSEQSQVKLIIKDMIVQAAAIGATGFSFGAGRPSANEAVDVDFEAFTNYCRWLCSELKPHGITALLEPFDTAVDKRFLYGPTKTCVELIESLKSDIDNFGIELDLAHVPLMSESFEHAIKTVAPHLKRVHLGNCVLKDKSNPRYGDTHPPIGFEGGQIDIPELTEILSLLLEVGFLNKKYRGSTLLEMTPWPGRSVEDTIADNSERIQKAWEAV